MTDILSVGEVSRLLGVCVKTFHRWDKAGQLTPQFRTLGGHRRYKAADVLNLKGLTQLSAERSIALYSRISSADQRQDLHRQAQRLRGYAVEKGIENVIEVSSIGSGMNFKRTGFLKILKLLFQGKISSIVVTHKDRLMRFGFALIERVCQYLNVKIIVIQDNDNVSDVTTQLTLDFVEIITVFSAKLYGRRSAQNKKLLSQGHALNTCTE